MGRKIVQLDMFYEDKESFEELTAKSMRALFASLTARNKAMDIVVENMTAMQEMVLRMNDRLNRLAEKS
jgi:hypothetical protein